MKKTLKAARTELEEAVEDLRDAIRDAEMTLSTLESADFSSDEDVDRAKRLADLLAEVAKADPIRNAPWNSPLDDLRRRIDAAVLEVQVN